MGHGTVCAAAVRRCRSRQKYILAAIGNVSRKNEGDTRKDEWYTRRAAAVVLQTGDRREGDVALIDLRIDLEGGPLIDGDESLEPSSRW